MNEELEMRRAEVVSLRQYYQEINPAIKELRLLLRSLSTIPNLTTREKYAIRTLLEEKR